ncbi:uncharacterized protein BO66DRAFT_392363 [Aspergillus aculeatinus CBS 121060]|uniref:Uncharacterized protein n=2 Tax=Aspergillus aculeatinus CBS 121060 TaxID=1448322 RepID=A0ACD1H840_9EURO|nr:hypothetical protein BO66DRAFT_392351 [Aspergillus aculeatinus CBS 121060]XP_025503512.1 hypothetical protein BO66DRAFT_392363 [Aspergillus aculeatinus CBS 121060]RAH69677.1 hypothetical protein BO66DRAFT_392351 [Aspergillus aculeatinus CBS 121060]RAH69689.1 hypothetical protein BO66DRAFT_392363 [Aspergillus aculeatinus CBS 121060]
MNDLANSRRYGLENFGRSVNRLRCRSSPRDILLYYPHYREQIGKQGRRESSAARILVLNSQAGL